jgi:hypothetical protein
MYIVVVINRLLSMFLLVLMRFSDKILVACAAMIRAKEVLIGSKKHRQDIFPHFSGLLNGSLTTLKLRS